MVFNIILEYLPTKLEEDVWITKIEKKLKNNHFLHMMTVDVETPKKSTVKLL